ncbi:hypothetical protein QEN19_001949 [Hanseniaspora menglaensis]
MDSQLFELIKNTYTAQEKAYAPYSNFHVGASIMIKNPESGIIKYVNGSNVENASYGGAICAERTAFVKAVSEGLRTNFVKVGVVGGENTEGFVSPCGICRQFMREFVDPKDLEIVMCRSRTTEEKKDYTFEFITKYKEGEDYIVKTLEELLPLSFGPDDL